MDDVVLVLDRLVECTSLSQIGDIDEEHSRAKHTRKTTVQPRLRLGGAAHCTVNDVVLGRQKELVKNMRTNETRGTGKQNMKAVRSALLRCFDLLLLLLLLLLGHSYWTEVMVDRVQLLCFSASFMDQRIIQHVRCSSRGSVSMSEPCQMHGMGEPQALWSAGGDLCTSIPKSYRCW